MAAHQQLWQQADTGTKMIHYREEHHFHHRVRRDISAGITGRTPTAAASKILKSATGARNYSSSAIPCCWAISAARTRSPEYLEVKNTVVAEWSTRASTSKIGEDQIFYCKQRGFSAEDAVSMIVHGSL